jgi:hypothetical protein
MGDVAYTVPPTWATGQILGRGQLGILVDNDRFFNGAADAWSPVMAGTSRGFIGTEPSLTVFDGYHLLRSDAKTLNYYIDVTAAATATLVLYYDGDAVASTTGGVASGTYDLSAKAAGLYRVHAVCTRTDIYASVGMVVMPPYTTYTGSRSFTTAPTITDGLTSAATHLNAWADNDRYFNDILRPNPAFWTIKRAWVGDETSLCIWRGWVRHTHDRLHYKVEITAVGDKHEHLHIKYDGSTVATISTQGVTEGTATISGTVGTDYLVEVYFDRDESGTVAQAYVHYLFEKPSAADAGFTNMGALTVGQDVYGDTAGQSTRLALLSSNDTNLNGRLWRRDYTVLKCEYPELGGTIGPTNIRHSILHRLPMLVYRGQNVTMTYGDDETVSLDDTDDEDYVWRTYDLGNVAGLVAGQVYVISGGESLDFAMEV